MRFIYLVAARGLSGIQHRYLSMVSRIAILGIAIGAATLVVVFSISSGITTAFKGKILALYPHVAVTPKAFDFRNYADVVDILSTVDGVEEALPATFDEVMIVHKDRREEVILKGVPLSTPRMQELLGSVSLPPESSELSRPPSLWSGAITARATRDRVTLRGGVRGSTARVLVMQRPQGTVQTWVWDDLWLGPVGGADRRRVFHRGPGPEQHDAAQEQLRADLEWAGGRGAIRRVQSVALIASSSRATWRWISAAREKS